MVAAPVTRPPTARIARAASAMVAPDVRMSSTIRHSRPARRGAARMLPARLPDRSAADSPQPLDFSAAMARLCRDVADRCETLHHVHMPRVLVSFTPSRNRSRYGLQARVTPLRFRAGALTRSLVERRGGASTVRKGGARTLRRPGGWAR